MRRWKLFAGLAILPLALTQTSAQTAQTAANPLYTHQEIMIPMRDGARMETVIHRPRGKTGPLPILLMRTPYGVPAAAPDGEHRSLEFLAADGYILVFQNMRGRFKSDGKFTMSMALQPPGSNAVDEATDGYDTIEWLVKNVPGNNGRVGMWGVSYPGYAAAIALARPHPALKAVSPQAAWIDWWQNDDLHRYGAIRLSYAADWLYGLQNTKGDTSFEYDDFDVYDWFLKLGPVENLDKNHVKGRVPMLTAMIEHPDYDSTWTRQVWSERLGRATVPSLHVTGFWDQEDPWGSWRLYERLERDDPDGLNMIVSGPWNHGSWRSAATTMGRIDTGKASGTDFRRDIEAPFFRHWLHGTGARPEFEAKMFQSGSWVWKEYRQWPPAGATATKLYLNADGSLSLTAPARATACRNYVSDPASPVPYRERPISPTYPSREWSWWETADQRFADHRPDVLSYVSAPLTRDMTVTGQLSATLFASTSGTDSDFVVKLIDVLPDDYETLPEDLELGDYTRSRNGYQLPIAMEIRRGRWLDSFTTPKPLVPNQVIAWDVPLRDHDHVFKRGHRIMVQVQSSWFPVIDRNPQSFVPNIAKAKPSDFVKATQRVCSGGAQASHISLPVMR